VTTASRGATHPGLRSSRVNTVRAFVSRPDFRRLYATRLFSQCADGVFQASLAGAVLFNPEQAADPGQVASGFAVLLLPYSLVGPFAGVLLDRWRRQRVIVISNLLRCLFVLAVAAEIAAGVSGLPFYATALVVISVNRFFLAAQSAAQPHVVTPAQLVSANALSTTSGTVITAVGGAVALGVRGIFGAGPGTYAIIAACSTLGYAGSALAGTGFPSDALGPDDVERCNRETVRDIARGLVAGGRHVLERRPTFAALAAIGAHRFFYGISTISLLLLYRNYFVTDGFFRSGLAGLGQAFAASAVGVLAAAAITPAVVRRTGKPAWITWVLVLAAVTEVLLGAPFTMQTLVPAALLLGFVAQASKICVDTIVQETVEDDFRGRVFSFYDVLFNVTFVAAAVAGAIILPASGKSYVVLGLIACGYALTAVGYAGVTRRHRTQLKPATAIA
jgi:MFS family permease